MRLLCTFDWNGTFRDAPGNEGGLYSKRKRRRLPGAR